MITYFIFLNIRIMCLHYTRLSSITLLAVRKLKISTVTSMETTNVGTYSLPRVLVLILSSLKKRNLNLISYTF